MWFNMTDNKFAFQNSPDITPFKIGISCLVHRVCCHLENCKTSDWGGVFFPSGKSLFNREKQKCKQINVLSNYPLSNL